MLHTLQHTKSGRVWAYRWPLDGLSVAVGGRRWPLDLLGVAPMLCTVFLFSHDTLDTTETRGFP